MARPKAPTISGPFDARHVAGVGLQGTAMPIPGLQRSSTSASRPDDASIYSVSTTANMPSRANTILSHSTSRPALRLKTSIARFRSHSKSPESSQSRKAHEEELQIAADKIQPPLPIINRANRADSGTAIDLTDVPVDARPLGFKEIMAVKTFEERMEMYKRTRDYWAFANHGLNEWVGKATAPKSVMAHV